MCKIKKNLYIKKIYQKKDKKIGSWRKVMYNNKVS